MGRFIVGLRNADGIRPGYQRGDKLFALDASQVPSFDWLLQHVGATSLVDVLEHAITEQIPGSVETSLRGLLGKQPVWAAGVTYKVSEEARERESEGSTIYTRVYSADRPEIFWKAIGYDVGSIDDPIGIRYDAKWSVPEPELTVVFNAHREVFGFTIGNDMSSRDIEGANPLYLPQAKTYEHSCVIGPRIWLQPNAGNWPSVEIQIEIQRNGEVVFTGLTHTQQLHRSLVDLSNYLHRCKTFNYGVLLMTGTGIVPPDDFTLAAGDIVRIVIEPIGELVNTVQLMGSYNQ